MGGMDPEQYLAGLNDEQRAAAQCVAGPVVIHAGAGTGKTRVISHRAAFAAASGAMEPGHALMVTFTDRAAGDMAERIRRLGVPGVTAMTFHKAAWRQLRHFWPRAGGAELEILSQPWRVVAPAVRRLPGHYRFTPTQDVLDTISWLRTGRIRPDRLAAAAAEQDRVLPLPDDLLLHVLHAYEHTKQTRGLVDFDDMILRTTDLLRDRPDFLAEVWARYAWFSIDEFQDTNPAQFELLRLWLGERPDVCVVGDARQTIYTFTGATARYLAGFEQWFPGAASFDLTTNYRSAPQILELANRLVGGGRLTATAPAGPVPVVTAYDDEDDERAAIVATVRDWAQAGVAYGEMAVLVRLNADLAPLEAALTRAGVPYVVRGTRFFQRREVQAALRALAQRQPEGADLAAWFGGVLAADLGYDPAEEPGTPEARERHAALQTLLDLVRDLATAGCDRDAVTAELRRRAEAEREAEGCGVTLSTVHRAKGLEWDAVILPGLEEGHLPVQQALKSPELLAEERRLLYVGITRARRHLVLSWSRERASGKARRSKRSRFLDGLVAVDRAPRRTAAAPVSGTAAPPAAGADPLYEALKQWRLERARADEVPAYVVFSNSTLALVARDRPATTAALAAVPGVGPAKLERYADEVLRIVAEH